MAWVWRFEFAYSVDASNRSSDIEPSMSINGFWSSSWYSTGKVLHFDRLASFTWMRGQMSRVVWRKEPTVTCAQKNKTLCLSRIRNLKVRLVLRHNFTRVCCWTQPVKQGDPNSHEDQENIIKRACYVCLVRRLHTKDKRWYWCKKRQWLSESCVVDSLSRAEFDCLAEPSVS